MQRSESRSTALCLHYQAEACSSVWLTRLSMSLLLVRRWDASLYCARFNAAEHRMSASSMRKLQPENVVRSSKKILHAVACLGLQSGQDYKLVWP